MSTVEEGRTVLFHYTGTLDDGSVFDSSKEREPMEVQVGSGQVIPGFESGILGMEEGETRSFTVPAAEAFGEHDETLCQWVEKARFADAEGIEVGRVCQVPLGDGRSGPGTVAEVGDEEVLLDLNHPLASKELTFEVECLEVKEE